MSFNCMTLMAALLCVPLLPEKGGMMIIYEEDSSRNQNAKHFLNTEEESLSPEESNREREAKTEKEVYNIQRRHQKITLFITGIHCIFPHSLPYLFRSPCDHILLTFQWSNSGPHVVQSI